ncbi:PAS domain-containing sensor histidine kinase [Rhodovibrio salinarum]|uniref:PAS domain-containing sensor histidine kinase n=1 Tax=Rhodovibrio salinarum TaxID=1087 RepID=UPI0014712787|nr:ATP-binding protein [Rhodovibrio salinarum]
MKTLQSAFVPPVLSALAALAAVYAVSGARSSGQIIAGLACLGAAGTAAAFAYRAQSHARQQADRLAQLEHIAAASTDWTWATDRALRFTHLSAKFEAAFGFPPSRVIGQTCDVLMSEENDPGEIAQHRADLRAQHSFRDVTYQSRRADGRPIWVRVSGVPVVDERGAFNGYRGVASDVTAQFLAEEAARAAQSQLVELTDSIPGAVVQIRHDEAGLQILFVSAGIESLYGVDKAQAYDIEKLIANIHHDDVDRMGAEMEAAYHAHRNFHLEYRIVVDGKVKWIRAQAVAHVERSGSVVWNGLLTDISRLKTAEAKLREQQDRYERAVRASRDGVWDYDLRTDTLYYSERCYELLGVTPDVLGDKTATFIERVHPHDRERLRETIRGHIKAGTPYDVEVRIAVGDLPDTWPEGKCELRWFRLRAETERDGQGQAVRIAGILSNIDELKRQERELIAARERAELANKSKTEFLANMSHELRTPLNAVIGFAEVIEGELLGPLGNPKYQSYAGDIRESGQHLLNLINDILDHAKIEAGRRELHEEWLLLPDLIKGTVRLVRERAVDRNLTLNVLPADELPRVFADQRGLKQILLNLLTNAIKFTPEGGEVTVGVQASGNGVWIEVTDTGIGIASEDIDKAMSPFGQANNWLTRQHEGTGLGLALCKQLAELHGGRLDLESELERGTRVRVTLPAERLEKAAAEQAQATAKSA